MSQYKLWSDRTFAPDAVRVQYRVQNDAWFTWQNYLSCVGSVSVILWFTLWDGVATEGIPHHKTFWNPRWAAPVSGHHFPCHWCTLQCCNFWILKRKHRSEGAAAFILLWLRTTTRQDWVEVWFLTPLTASCSHWLLLFSAIADSFQIFSILDIWEV